MTAATHEDVMTTDADEIIRQHYQKLAALRMQHTLPCVVCGTPMQEVMAKRRYCSERCKSRHRRQRERAYVRQLEATVKAISPAAEVSGNGKAR